METVELNTQQPVNFIKEGAKAGLINGGIALLLMYGGYFAGLNSFVTIQFADTFLPYMIIVLIIYGLRLRKRNGGYLSFREGLQFSFMSYVVAGLLVAVGTYILYNFIDKDLTQKSFDISIQKMKEFSRNMGVPDEKIDQELGTKNPQKTTLGNIFVGMGARWVLDFVKSLLISLVIRKEKPVV